MNIDYISGFFDADGSITMSKPKSTDPYRTLKIDFTNTKVEILLLRTKYKLKQGIIAYLSAPHFQSFCHCMVRK